MNKLWYFSKYRFFEFKISQSKLHKLIKDKNYVFIFFPIFEDTIVNMDLIKSIFDLKISDDQNLKNTNIKNSTKNIYHFINYYGLDDILIMSRNEFDSWFNVNADKSKKYVFLNIPFQCKYHYRKLRYMGYKSYLLKFYKKQKRLFGNKNKQVVQ